MERKLSYDISYSQLKSWRKYENWALYISMGCTLLKPIVLSIGIVWIIGIINFLAFISLVLYGLLFVVVEIFLQPRVATERQKGLLDNSLGTKLLIGNTEGYYDNDNVLIGAKNPVKHKNLRDNINLGVNGLLTMCDCNICEFPQASASDELAKHQHQQMVPVRHRPAFGSVVVLGEYSPELSLREELYYLCKNEYPSMHICSDLKSDAKVSISKPGQGIGGLKRCA